MKRWTWLVGATVLAGVALLFVAGPTGQSHAQESKPASTQSEKPVTITIAPVTVRPVQRLVGLVGTLFGKEEIPITPEVDGRIVRVQHDVGDTVRAGDVLFEIDPRAYQLAVNEAQRALDLELAKLSLKTVPSADAEPALAALPSVVKAASQLKLAELQHERARLLWNQKSISKDEWDRAETDLTLARAVHEQAMLDVRTDWAAMRQKQAILDSAQERLADTIVRVPAQSETLTGKKGPVDYVVAERTITEGEMIASMPGRDPAFRLVIPDPLKLDASLAERYSAEIKVGQRAGCKTEATGEKIHFGKVTRVNPTVDRASRSFRVEIEIPNSDRLLPPGSFARAAIETRVDREALSVPAEAVVRFAGMVKVFVIRDGRAIGVAVKLGERLEVPVGDSTQTWIEVTGPIKAGESIATSGQSQLADQTPVTVREVKLATGARP